MTAQSFSTEIEVIDSHTEGEPTRIVVAGGPNLGSGDMLQRREIFRTQFDEFRSAVITEPRGSDVLVGGLLCEPPDSSYAAAIVFFNNTGYLGMCGHGTIGLMVTLHYLGRIGLGRYRVATPVGVVTATLHDPARVTVENVPAYRFRKQVIVEVDHYGTVVGDVAWGGNWFFLVKETPERISLDNVECLTRVTKMIEVALAKSGITGASAERIDHVELYGSGAAANADSQNFVLCPGGEYDRSPCGTGTSAKLACLADDGLLQPGQTWRQAGILGSCFDAHYERRADGAIIPFITGRAFISAHSRLLLQADDPFRFGIRG